MTDPKPLAELGDEETTQLERALLRSWKHESPPASARARALAIAGLAAGTSAAPDVKAAPGANAAPAPKAAAGKLPMLAKWGLGTVIGAGILGAGVALLRPSAAPSAGAPPGEPPAASALPAASAPPVVAAGGPTAASAPAVAPAPTPAEPVARAPIPPEASALPRRGPAAVASPPRPKNAAPRARSAPVDPAPIDPADALREQVAMIDRARDALRAGDAAGCLAALDAHDERFPRSAMAEEATVLRIEALLRLGDRARAADLGERFLASRPTSPHAAGVRALLGMTGATTDP
ncbi:outer membrane protein assembly factor BamD [Sorangium sp. So ce315]|uniref:outer membrane protein assembly factor BamD n=1 Tax=Sorangium sp. So ce315 TaxID=3133299 RepID=UPI003F62ED9F